jgi:hypothetical protein
MILFFRGLKNMKKSKIKGKRRTVWLPYDLDQKAEKARKKLGLGFSAFYRFAIIEVVKQFEIEDGGTSNE